MITKVYILVFLEMDFYVTKLFLKTSESSWKNFTTKQYPFMNKKKIKQKL